MSGVDRARKSKQRQWSDKPIKLKPRDAKTIVGLCILVAEAAGGFFQFFNPISEEERAAIEKEACAQMLAGTARLISPQQSPCHP